MFCPALASAFAVALAAASTSEPPAVLITRQLAEAEHLSVGDAIRMSSDPNGKEPRSFRIAAIYEPTPDPMRLVAKRYEVRLHLPDMLAFTGEPESVSAINVALKDPADATAFARDLAARVSAAAKEALDVDELGVAKVGTEPAAHTTTSPSDI
jgi:ABC-type lipoprotein release transport system permease subunit